jgi:hypothetical protein
MRTGNGPVDNKRGQTLLKEAFHPRYVVMGPIEVVPFFCVRELFPVLRSVLFGILIRDPNLHISSAKEVRDCTGGHTRRALVRIVADALEPLWQSNCLMD